MGGVVHEVPEATAFDRIVGYDVPVDPASLIDCESCQ